MKNNLIRDKSFDFALKTIELSKLLLKHQEIIISNQFGKSGTSVGANVAESEFAESRADFIHKLSIARKEARESKYWLELIQKSESIKIEVDELVEEIKSIIAILNAIIKSSKNNS